MNNTVYIEGKPIEEVIVSKKGASRVQWSLVSSEGISIPFDGTPFMCVGQIYYQCHQGDDVDRSTKNRRQKARHKNEVMND